MFLLHKKYHSIIVFSFSACRLILSVISFSLCNFSLRLFTIFSCILFISSISFISSLSSSLNREIQWALEFKISVELGYWVLLKCYTNILPIGSNVARALSVHPTLAVSNRLIFLISLPDWRLVQLQVRSLPTAYKTVSFEY